ncbi:hypothetical protein IFM89_014115 [Coptis chinensis]|uniref:Cyclin-dependent kinase inhibitor domain-containing protein n=1 Tax=Coptis chinensis TaxID=261450 RepID=A0A835HU51_9MAGN|nr:hypothetical protein IFM89_010347 [Coptis chinensis]KAF9605124.1 hypothetical protein IFM89_014115 [Coptis chinensis]
MGKYMRKAKITGEIAVMELATTTTTSLVSGVRTRAKTLALQRLQKTTSGSSNDSSSCYLQLRSRRLEKKPPSLLSGVSHNHNTTATDSNKKPNPNPSSRLANNSASVASVSLRNEKKSEDGSDNFHDLGVAAAVEASFGENVLEIEGRSTRETTPCSLIRGSDTVRTPGSTTRRTNSAATNRRIQSSIRRNVPTPHEMEEFFAGAEQQQQRVFTEKYNFDPVNDSPLPGRYEWQRVDP